MFAVLTVGFKSELTETPYHDLFCELKHIGRIFLSY